MAQHQHDSHKVTTGGDTIFVWERDDWQARLYINNLFDERGITYNDSQDFDQVWGRGSANVIRPRNWGFSVRKSW